MVKTDPEGNITKASHKHQRGKDANAFFRQSNTAMHDDEDIIMSKMLRRLEKSTHARIR